MRSACGERPSAAAYSACPIPLKFIASICMLQNAKSNRFAVLAHAVAIAPRPPASLRSRLLALSFKLFQAQIPQAFLTFAQIFPAQQMTRPQHERRRRNIAPAAIFLHVLMAVVSGRNVVRPVRIVGLCKGTVRRHRRSSMSRRSPTSCAIALPEVRAEIGRLLGRPIKRAT